ncbi:MAG: hypothetical protein GWP91_07890 [Rhodobacterales bacterium]|nr:hypothetical protein [Rhodobacterales bacterium]
MRAPQPSLIRRLIPWIMVGAYVLAIAVSGIAVYSLRDSQRAQVISGLEDALQDNVAAWEDELLGGLAEFMDVAARDSDRPALRQNGMRRRAAPWFNSLYLWTPPQALPSLPDEVQAVFLFPSPPILEDGDLMRSRMCLRTAGILRSDKALNPVFVARAYVLGCRREVLTVRLLASNQAAYLLSSHGLYTQALEALEAAGLPDDLSLVQATAESIPPRSIMATRAQRADILSKLGQVDEALVLWERLGLEIAELDAPNAAPLIPHIRWPILHELRQHQRDDAVRRVEVAQGRAERRVAAYRELSSRVATQAPPSNMSEPAKFSYDQYSDPPFLLYYGWVDDTGVALQLEQAGLIGDFLSSKGVTRLRRWLTITDTSGELVAGVRRGGDIILNVQFSQTLSHLRIGLREGAVDNRLARMRDGWLTPLIVVALAALLGLSALIVQIRASRQQTALLGRQREFTTRVTHELKTPLAGIRIMAENIELGAFRGKEQRIDMARRIVNETDRLTARVDEVLAASRRRSIPDPESFDPEEPLLECIDQWGPRLENADVQLHADLHPTDEVMGDMNAIRDAVSCLLDNALKYRRTDRDDSQVWLELKQEGNKVLIDVYDNGLGVPADKRSTIFHRFVRVEGPNRGLAGGYGLGLAQVHQIAKIHGGSVRCVEGVNGGARFELRLPVTP